MDTQHTFSRRGFLATAAGLALAAPALARPLTPEIGAVYFAQLHEVPSGAAAERLARELAAQWQLPWPVPQVIVDSGRGCYASFRAGDATIVCTPHAPEAGQAALVVRGEHGTWQHDGARGWFSAC